MSTDFWGVIWNLFLPINLRANREFEVLTIKVTFHVLSTYHYLRPWGIWCAQSSCSGGHPRQIESFWSGKQVNDHERILLVILTLFAPTSRFILFFLLQVPPDPLSCPPGNATCIQAKAVRKPDAGWHGPLLWHLLLSCFDRWRLLGREKISEWSLML